MELSQGRLGLLLVLGVLTGGALGLLYDVLGFSHALFHFPCPKHPRVCAVCRQILLFGQDILFVLCASWSPVILLYYTNDGVFRLLAVCGMACGFLLYRLTLGKAVALFVPVAVRGVRRLCRVLWMIGWMPLRLAASVLTALWRCTAGKCFLMLRRARSKRSINQLVEAASVGFDLPSGSPKQK